MLAEVFLSEGNWCLSEVLFSALSSAQRIRAIESQMRRGHANRPPLTVHGNLTSGPFPSTGDEACRCRHFLQTTCQLPTNSRDFLTRSFADDCSFIEAGSNSKLIKILTVRQSFLFCISRLPSCLPFECGEVPPPTEFEPRWSLSFDTLNRREWSGGIVVRLYFEKFCEIPLR